MVLRRIAGRHAWRRNPLRRASDRWEARVTAVLVVILVAAGPWSGWWAARTAYREAVREQEWDRRHRFLVQALLVADPAQPQAVAATGARSALTTDVAQGRWTAPDGSARLGEIEVVRGARIGDRITIWVDYGGAALGPPLPHRPRVDAGVAAAGMNLALLGLLATFRVVTRRLLDRRRLRR